MAVQTIGQWPMSIPAACSDCISTESCICVARSGVTCPDHPEAPLIEDHHAGDMVCPECGLVVGDR